MRLIDANALIEKKRKICTGHGEYDYVVDLWNIEHAPAVDAVGVVHGRWKSRPIYKINGEGRGIKYCDFHYCSECGTGRPMVPPYNYCPNCGAKMDGDGNG